MVLLLRCRFFAVSIVILLALVAFSDFSPRAGGQGAQGSLVLDPQLVNTMQGFLFNMNVTVQNVTNLGWLGANLDFNTSRISMQTYVIRDGWNGGCAPSSPPDEGLLFSASSNAGSFTGSAVVLTITFRCEDAGLSQISIASDAQWKEAPGYPWHSFAVRQGATVNQAAPVTVTSTTTATTTVTTTLISVSGAQGSSSITSLASSPSSGYVNQPVTISGILQGQWNGLTGGIGGKLVQISASWGFSVNVNTGPSGQFSTTTNCPAGGGVYSITATFAGDALFTGSSANIPNYQVNANVDTTLTLAHRYVAGDMGGSRLFYGYLRRKDNGQGVGGMAVRLTIYSGGYSYIFDVATRSDGYFEYRFTTNNGVFTWAEARFAGSGLYLASFSGRIYP